MTDATIKTKGPGWSQILVFSLWFATDTIVWGFYNNYIPVLLQAGGANYNVQGVSAALDGLRPGGRPRQE